MEISLRTERAIDSKSIGDDQTLQGRSSTYHRYGGGSRMPLENHLRIMMEGHNTEHLELKKPRMIEKEASWIYDE